MPDGCFYIDKTIKICYFLLKTNIHPEDIMKHYCFALLVLLSLAGCGPLHTAYTLQEDPNELYIPRGTRATLERYFEPSLLPYFTEEMAYTKNDREFWRVPLPAGGGMRTRAFLGFGFEEAIFLDPTIRLHRESNQLLLVHEALHAVYNNAMHALHSSFEADVQRLFNDSFRYDDLVSEIRRKLNGILYADLDDTTRLTEYYAYIGQTLVDPYRRCAAPPYIVRHYEGVLRTDKLTCRVQEPSSVPSPIKDLFIAQFDHDGQRYVMAAKGLQLDVLARGGGVIRPATDDTAIIASACHLAGEPTTLVVLESAAPCHMRPDNRYLSPGLQPLRALFLVIVRPASGSLAARLDAPYVVRFATADPEEEITTVTIDRRSVTECGGNLFADVPWDKAKVILEKHHQDQLVVTCEYGP